MFRLRGLLVVMLSVALCVLAYVRGRSDPLVLVNHLARDGRGSLTILSPIHTIDRIYPSMHGPSSVHGNVYLAADAPRQILFVTGIESKLVGGDGRSPVSREFFCHSNLVVNPHAAADALPRTLSSDARLFTLIPGRLDVALPAGFGIPVRADEPLEHYTMALNLNHHGPPIDVRVRTTVSFADPEKAPLKPLFRRAVYAYERLATTPTTAPSAPASSAWTSRTSSGLPGMMCVGGDAGASCGPATPTAAGPKSASSGFVASVGKTNTVHWLIPPGKYESRVVVTDQLDLPYDTTAHYVTGHLHPYAKSLALVDKTSAQEIFIIRSTDFSDRIGVGEMEQWSSPAGVLLEKAHQYELVTTYVNPTDKPIDAMSILYLYALDKRYEQQAHDAVAQR
jgi:hypothetical protein